MGNFDRPVNKIFISRRWNNFLLSRNPLPTSSNISAHKKLKEILSI